MSWPSARGGSYELALGYSDWKCKSHRLLAHNDSFHGLDLGHVVIVGPQLPLLDALVDPHQQVPGYVLTVVHPLNS